MWWGCVERSDRRIVGGPTQSDRAATWPDNVGNRACSGCRTLSASVRRRTIETLDKPDKTGTRHPPQSRSTTTRMNTNGLEFSLQFRGDGYPAIVIPLTAHQGTCRQPTSRPDRRASPPKDLPAGRRSSEMAVGRGPDDADPDSCQAGANADLDTGAPCRELWLAGWRGQRQTTDQRRRPETGRPPWHLCNSSLRARTMIDDQGVTKLVTSLSPIFPEGGIAVMKGVLWWWLVWD